MPNVLNPFQVGIFAAQLFCHKVIRWFALYFMFGALVTSGIMAAGGSKFYLLLFAIQCGCYAIGLAARWTSVGRFKPAMLMYYFCLANVAGGLGVFKFMLGRKFITWTPQREAPDSESNLVSKD